MSKEEHLKLDIDWDAPPEVEEPKVTVAIIREANRIQLGLSPTFPDSVVLLFREGPHALVLQGLAMESLLHEMLGMLILLGVVPDPDLEGLKEASGLPKKKITLH